MPRATAFSSLRFSENSNRQVNNNEIKKNPKTKGRQTSLPVSVCVLLKAAQRKSSMAAANASHRHLHHRRISPSLCVSSPMWMEAHQTGENGGMRPDCVGRLNDCFHLVLHASSTTVATAPGIIILITATRRDCSHWVGLLWNFFLFFLQQHLVSNQRVTCVFPLRSLSLSLSLSAVSSENLIFQM